MSLNTRRETPTDPHICLWTNEDSKDMEMWGMCCMQTVGSIRNTGITLQILFQSRSSGTQPHQTHVIFLFTNAFRHLIIACGMFTRGCALEQILGPYALEQSPVPQLQPKVAWVLGKSSVLLSLGGWMYSLACIISNDFLLLMFKWDCYSQMQHLPLIMSDFQSF